jgi:hypothetical protein
MREFRITFATNDSSGIYRGDIAEKIGEKLAGTYGGFTRTDGYGGYTMTNGNLLMESVFVFDVATNEGPDSVFSFAGMAAMEIKRTMGQESVYFRNVNGFVSIL